MNYNANDPNTEMVLCAVCDNNIHGGHWFARRTHGGVTVALCCPLCLDAFEAKPEVYVGRVATFADMPAKEYLSFNSEALG